MQLETSVRYEGLGIAEFGNPVIRVVGPTVVTTDEQGSTLAHLTVSQIPTSSTFSEGLQMLSRDFFRNTHDNGTTCTVSVECSDGTFSAKEQTFRDLTVNLEDNTASVQLTCNRSNFEAADRSPKYWRFPIWNFHGSLRPAQRTPRFNHPLRLFTEHPVSFFEIDGEIAFIEAVPDREKIIDAQLSGIRSARVTAIMVGAFSGTKITFNNLLSWLPFRYLNLLGLSSGSRVGIPWIEFLDGEGCLIRRLHIRVGTNQYERGHKFLDDLVHHGGLGQLLTRGTTSPELRENYLGVALGQLLLGVRNGQALEDKMSHISRAIDALTKHFGLGTQDLLAGADEAVKSRVKHILNHARMTILDLASEADLEGRTILASGLRRVAERAASTPANKDGDWGLAVLSLLDRFDLNDDKVVGQYYTKHPRADGRKWHQVLSYYRGIAQHGDSFNFHNGDSIVQIFRVLNHLADIAARIIFKLLAYDGEYQPTNGRWGDTKSVEWIQPTTAPADLGYGAGAHD